MTRPTADLQEVAGGRRERVEVAGVDRLGSYTLLRLARGGLDPGQPGQFFMLEAPGRLLPRPFSVCTASGAELGFLIDVVGPGTRALAALRPRQAIHAFGPLGKGFDLTVERPFLVGGGIGMAPLPYLSERLGGAQAAIGFRTAEQAEAAVLVPGARVVLEPTLVTEALPDEPVDLLACGPEAMLHALAARSPDAQLAWEAPMACGYGACYGCVVQLPGGYRRLCIDGPVVRGSQVTARAA